jgi:type IV pilus assembly protein PilW
MSALPCTRHPRSSRTQRGFTLVELMVTVAIALFLLYGLVTIVQTVRRTSLDQQSLAQLQDQQRFAMTVLTDVIQAGGYFPDPTAWTLATSLPTQAPFGQGQPFFGTHNAAVPGDKIGVRYRTKGGDGVINCTGGTNPGLPNTTLLYTNTFSVVPVVGFPGQFQLQCALGVGAVVGAGVPLVSGVTNLTIYYGVKRNFAVTDYNVDTYLTANQMLATDWDNISSVRVILTFTNPLYKGPGGGQQQFITFDRVVEVMAHAGPYT